MTSSCERLISCYRTQRNTVKPTSKARTTLMRFHLATTLAATIKKGGLRFRKRRHLKTLLNPETFENASIRFNVVARKRSFSKTLSSGDALLSAWVTKKKQTCIYGTNITTWFNSITKQLGISLLLMLDRFQKRISVDGWKRSENDAKTLVWMQIFCSVSIRWKRCVFKNALVWFRPKLMFFGLNWILLWSICI